MKYQYIGKDFNRPDAFGKVTGEAIYLVDLPVTPDRIKAALKNVSG